MPGGDGNGAHDPAALRGVREGEAVREELTMSSKTAGWRRPKTTALAYSNTSIPVLNRFEELTRRFPDP